MKVILVYPPKGANESPGAEWFPLGIASIAANLTGVNVVCLDLLNHEYKGALNAITGQLDVNKLNVIGFTMMTDRRAEVKRLATVLKGPFFKGFRIKIVVGGPHPSIMTDQIASMKCFDYVITGEGEKAFKHLVNNIDSCDKVINGEEMDIDAIEPAINGIQYFYPAIDQITEAPIVFSRGCDGFCTFCATNKVWKSYRARSADCIYDEILGYYRTYGTRSFKIHDDSATSDQETINRLAAMLASSKKLDISFEITTRIDRLTPDLIKMLARAGCRQIAVGIESGSYKMRKAMGKGDLDMGLARDLTHIAQQNGIKIHYLLIVGYPGETQETINETCDMLLEHKPNSYSFLEGLLVIPGTPVYNKLKRDGWIDDSYWLSDAPAPTYTGEYSKEQLWDFGAQIRHSGHNSKVLIAAPVCQDESTFKKYLESIDNLEIPRGMEVSKLFLLHNSPNLGKYLKPSEYLEINDDTPDYKGHNWNAVRLERIAKMKNQIVQIALQSGATHIYWVDSDIILPPNALKKLFYIGVPVISSIFWTKWPGFDKEMPNCWDYDFYTFVQDANRFRVPGTYEVGGTGACVLVNTAVYARGAHYEKIPGLSWSQWEDRAFCVRCRVLGIPIYANSELDITHLYGGAESGEMEAKTKVGEEKTE